MKQWELRGVTIPRLIEAGASQENPSPPSADRVELDVPPPARSQEAEAGRQLLHQFPGIVWVVDEDLRFTVMLGRGLVDLGLGPNQVAGATVHDLFESDDPDLAVVAAHLRALEGEAQACRVEMGATVLDVRVAPLRDAAGGVIGAIGTALPVREQWATGVSAAPGRVAAAAGGAADTGGAAGATIPAQIVAERFPGVFWTVDADLRFTSSLGAGLATLGRAPGDSVGRTMQESFGTDDPSFAPIAAHRRALEGETVAYEIEWKGRTFHARVEPLPGADGRPGGVVGVAVDITERKRAEEEVAYLAYHDGLTGLPNRALLEEHLEREIAVALREGLSVVVLHVDLDDFRVVNGNLGHAAGDAVLREVAERLDGACGEGAMVSRLGADEFLVAMTCPGSPPASVPGGGNGSRRPDPAMTAARASAVRIQEAMDRPFWAGATEFYLSASIGIALCPHHASDAGALLRAAGDALHGGPRRGPGRCVVYGSSDAEAVDLELVTALRRTARDGRWALRYQPIVELATGRVTGVEALLRWPHPSGRILGPEEFLPLAEHLGLGGAIGSWVLEEACGQVATWREQGMGLSVAVNLSPGQLHDEALVTSIPSRVREAGLEPESVVLEITETAAMADPDRTRLALRRLSRRGLRLAIDDFGTGYSSLSRLRSLPVDILKIDGSFVAGLPRNRNDASLVTAMIGLARSLGMEPVAEGIETEAQRRFLIDRECRTGQGFQLCRPLLAHEVAGRCA